MIEALEHRLLMRLGGVQFDGRTVTISGTGGDDVISYRGDRSGLFVLINERPHTVQGERIGRIVVWAGAGDDIVDGGAGRYPNRVLTKVAAYVDGGAGDDHLYSTRAADTLLGSTGNDFLQSGAYQSTYMDGGVGDDRMYYGGCMNGGRGNDVAVKPDYNLTVVSGLERLYTVNNPDGSDPRPTPVGPDSYVGNLKAKNGRLVFRYPATADLGFTLTGPTVRPDGMLEITRGFSPDAPRVDATISLDAADATRRGVVLFYGDRGAAYSEQVVLIPSA